MCTLEDRFVVSVRRLARLAHGSATSCASDVLQQCARALQCAIFCFAHTVASCSVLTPHVICSFFSYMRVKVKAKYNCKTVTIIANADSIAHWLRASFGKREVGALDF